jgi:phosphatidate cytidylyltransferase
MPAKLSLYALSDVNKRKTNLPIFKPTSMAFNLRTLGTRSLSALFFVVLLLGSVTWNYLSFTVFFLVVALGALHEYFNLVQHMGIRAYRVAGFLCALVLYLLFVNFEVFACRSLSDHLFVICILPVLIFGITVFSRESDPVNAGVYTVAGLVYCVLPFALLHQVVMRNAGNDPVYDPTVILGMIFLIWANDTFAYLCGNLFGKNKMIERISPGKTWEGTIGGILVSFGVSFLIKNYMDVNSGVLWPVLGIVVPVLATIGDLVQSLLKRKAGVKDSGSIMPGHGGVLDRFDSLVFVSPFVVVLVGLLKLH